MTIAKKLPIGLETFCVKGPAKKDGVLSEIFIKPWFIKNHIQTSPPCIPMHFHNDPLSFLLTKDRKIARKNHPRRNAIIFPKELSEIGWIKLKTNACVKIAIFIPYSIFNSSKNQALKIIYSAIPIPKPSEIEFNNMSEENSPIQVM